VVELEERARRAVTRRPERGPCDWKDCDAEATRQLGFGRVDEHALPAPARYCDEHGDQVQAIFLVEYDLVLETTVRAA
jgi:hypothetical protein